MILAADCFAGTALRRFVLALLAFVMPFQAMASAAFTAMGPAHVHEAPAQGMVLVDVRRAAYGTVERAHLDIPFLHTCTRPGRPSVTTMHPTTAVWCWPMNPAA